MTPLVFWHGWGLGSFVWDGLINALRGQAPSFQYTAKPLAGYDGQTHSPTFLDGLLDMTPVPDPSIVCAWSMGALLALLAAYRYPGRIKKLILIGATPCFLKRDNWEHGLDRPLLLKLRQDIQADLPTAMRHFTALFNQKDQNARKIARRFSAVPYPSLEVLDAGLQILQNTDLRQIIPSIRQKTLLLHGENDPLMPLTAARWLGKALPNASLSVFENTAHAPFLSEPEKCASRLVDFLNDA